MNELDMLAEEMEELSQVAYVMSLKLQEGYINNEEAVRDIQYIASGLMEFQKRIINRKK